MANHERTLLDRIREFLKDLERLISPNAKPAPVPVPIPIPVERDRRR